MYELLLTSVLLTTVSVQVKCRPEKTAALTFHEADKYQERVLTCMAPNTSPDLTVCELAVLKVIGDGGSTSSMMLAQVNFAAPLDQQANRTAVVQRLPGISVNVSLVPRAISLHITHVTCQNAGTYVCNARQAYKGDAGKAAGKDECQTVESDVYKAASAWQSKTFYVEVEPGHVSMTSPLTKDDMELQTVSCNVHTTLPVEWVWETKTANEDWVTASGNITTDSGPLDNTDCFARSSRLKFGARGDVIRCYVIARNHSYVDHAAYQSFPVTEFGLFKESRGSFFNNGGISVLLVGGTGVVLFVILVMLIKVQRQGGSYRFTFRTLANRQDGPSSGGGANAAASTGDGAILRQPVSDGEGQNQRDPGDGSEAGSKGSSYVSTGNKKLKKVWCTISKWKPRDHPAPSAASSDPSAPTPARHKKRSGGRAGRGKQRTSRLKEDGSGAGDPDRQDKGGGQEEHKAAAAAMAVSEGDVKAALASARRLSLTHSKGSLADLDRVLKAIGTEAELATARMLDHRASISVGAALRQGPAPPLLPRGLELSTLQKAGPQPPGNAPDSGGRSAVSKPTQNSAVQTKHVTDSRIPRHTKASSVNPESVKPLTVPDYARAKHPASHLQPDSPKNKTGTRPGTEVAGEVPRYPFQRISRLKSRKIREVTKYHTISAAGCRGKHGQYIRSSLQQSENFPELGRSMNKSASSGNRLAKVRSRSVSLDSMQFVSSNRKPPLRDRVGSGYSLKTTRNEGSSGSIKPGHPHQCVRRPSFVRWQETACSVTRIVDQFRESVRDGQGADEKKLQGDDKDKTTTSQKSPCDVQSSESGHLSICNESGGQPSEHSDLRPSEASEERGGGSGSFPRWQPDIDFTDSLVIHKRGNSRIPHRIATHIPRLKSAERQRSGSGLGSAQSDARVKPREADGDSEQGLSAALLEMTSKRSSSLSEPHVANAPAGHPRDKPLTSSCGHVPQQLVSLKQQQQPIGSLPASAGFGVSSDRLLSVDHGSPDPSEAFSPGASAASSNKPKQTSLASLANSSSRLPGSKPEQTSPAFLTSSLSRLPSCKPEQTSLASLPNCPSRLLSSKPKQTSLASLPNCPSRLLSSKPEQTSLASLPNCPSRLLISKPEQTSLASLPNCPSRLPGSKPEQTSLASLPNCPSRLPGSKPEQTSLASLPNCPSQLPCSKDEQPSLASLTNSPSRLPGNKPEQTSLASLPNCPSQLPCSKDEQPSLAFLTNCPSRLPSNKPEQTSLASLPNCPNRLPPLKIRTNPACWPHPAATTTVSPPTTTTAATTSITPTSTAGTEPAAIVSSTRQSVAASPASTVDLEQVCFEQLEQILRNDTPAEDVDLQPMFGPYMFRGVDPSFLPRGAWLKDPLRVSPRAKSGGGPQAGSDVEGGRCANNAAHGGSPIGSPTAVLHSYGVPGDVSHGKEVVGDVRGGGGGGGGVVGGGGRGGDDEIEKASISETGSAPVEGELCQAGVHWLDTV